MNVSESIGGPEGAAVWDNLWEVVTYASAVLESIRRTHPISNPLIRSPWTVFKEEDHQMSIPSIQATISPDITAKIKQTLQNAAWSHLQGSPAALKSWRNARFNVFDNETNEASAAYVSLPLGHKCLLNETVRDEVVFFEPLTLEDGTRIGSVQLASSHILGMPTISTTDQ